MRKQAGAAAGEADEMMRAFAWAREPYVGREGNGGDREMEAGYKGSKEKLGCSIGVLSSCLHLRGE